PQIASHENCDKAVWRALSRSARMLIILPAHKTDMSIPTPDARCLISPCKKPANWLQKGYKIEAGAALILGSSTSRIIYLPREHDPTGQAGMLHPDQVWHLSHGYHG